MLYTTLSFFLMISYIFITSFTLPAEFLKEVRSLQKSLKELTAPKNNVKLLVHCGNGAGRTGVFVLCETLIRLIENNQVFFVSFLEQLWSNLRFLYPLKLFLRSDAKKPLSCNLSPQVTSRFHHLVC